MEDISKLSNKELVKKFQVFSRYMGIQPIPFVDPRPMYWKETFNELKSELLHRLNAKEASQ